MISAVGDGVPTARAAGRRQAGHAGIGLPPAAPHAERGALTCAGNSAEVAEAAGQEATVRTGHGTTDWFQIGKGVRQGCMLSPCLFNLYAEHIMGNARLDEAQAGIKIARRNIDNLRLCR